MSGDELTPRRLPTYFASHGGGPWPWIKDQLPGDWLPLERSLQSIPVELGRAPKAILVISGHWEEPEFTVQTSPSPPMLYDYGGFPPETYEIEYPAPGSPEVAQRVGALLDAAAIPVRFDAERGFDHGVFAPLFVMYPHAEVPILQLSLKHGYDPDAHLAVGRALSALRDEDVLVFASGFSYHNLANFGPSGAAASRSFDAWLTHATVAVPPHERLELLRHWDKAPSARAAHPAEDHLAPLFVALGAAEDEPGVRFYHQEDFWGSLTSSSYRFGEVPRQR
jgi:aromatic ring-opening dioxygenase catalytic subunit (LigB family)